VPSTWARSFLFNYVVDYLVAVGVNEASLGHFPLLLFVWFPSREVHFFQSGGVVTSPLVFYFRFVLSPRGLISSESKASLTYAPFILPMCRFKISYIIFFLRVFPCFPQKVHALFPISSAQLGSKPPLAFPLQRVSFLPFLIVD